jgi:hypothetical protein
MKMAARSTIVKVVNRSSYKLFLVQSSLQLQHGIWDSYPPQKIAAEGTGSWETESDGFMTGDEGQCAYQFIDEGGESISKITITWDDPFVGSNQYSISSDSASVKVSYSGGGGNNATVTYTIVNNG